MTRYILEDCFSAMYDSIKCPSTDTKQNNTQHLHSPAPIVFCPPAENHADMELSIIARLVHSPTPKGANKHTNSRTYNGQTSHTVNPSNINTNNCSILSPRNPARAHGLLVHMLTRFGIVRGGHVDQQSSNGSPSFPFPFTKRHGTRWGVSNTDGHIGTKQSTRNETTRYGIYHAASCLHKIEKR